jgi:hypothetical protein
VNERSRLLARQVVKMQQALTKTIPPPTACQDQSHGRRSNRAVFVADKPLQNPRLPPTAPRFSPGCNPLLVGPTQQQTDE